MLENIYERCTLPRPPPCFHSCHSLCVPDAVGTQFLTVVTFSTCSFLAAIDSPHSISTPLLMWCVYTQPPKKALDYVQDRSLCPSFITYKMENLRVRTFLTVSGCLAQNKHELSICYYYLLLVTMKAIKWLAIIIHTV